MSARFAPSSQQAFHAAGVAQVPVALEKLRKVVPDAVVSVTEDRTQTVHVAIEASGAIARP